MKIEKVTIKNFRSFKNETVEVSDINVFVGKNDAGKSNFLRALDLFFNHDNGYQLNWDKDYCYAADEIIKKAPQIEITLIVFLPKSFSDKKRIRWVKTWRRSGLHSERMIYSDNTKISSYSKAPALLHYARLDYVPAIKDPEYFSGLLAKLHDMLEQTVEEKVRSAAETFTRSINEHTTDIIGEISSQLGFDSSIELPADLRDLFGRLEFSGELNGNKVSLDQRGDGIKTRHIPIILKWLAKQAETLSAPGRPKTVTLWAYEEPENSLEMLNCIELAERMILEAKNIQIFISTHSPAFYSRCLKSDKVETSVFSVHRDSDLGLSKIKTISESEISVLDDSVGMTPIVQPYLDRAFEEIRMLRENATSLKDFNKPVCFVEGVSDKIILDKAVSIYYPSLVDSFEVKAEQAAGYNWVHDMLTAWCHMRGSALAIGLFDKDPGAVVVKKKVTEALKDKKPKNWYCMFLEPSDTLKLVLSSFKIPFEIEDLFDPDIWDHAEINGWLENRPGILDIYGFDDYNCTFTDFIVGKVGDEKLQRYALKRVKKTCKDDFSSYVISSEESDLPQTLSGVKPTLDKIISTLRLIEQ